MATTQLPEGFVRMDFHVHTPLSRCYEDNMYPEQGHHTTVEEIVAAAQNAGLQAMVISDHNGASSIASVQRAAEAVGLTIFPGMELTTQGGHLLAVFNPDTPLATLERLLDQLEFPESERGNGSYSTHLWLDEAARYVVDAGGLAIPAHIDREPRGFAAGYIDTNTKRRIHGCDFLSALEITDPRSKEQWASGTMRGFSKPYPVLQGSDAHAAREIGRRPVLLRASELSLAGLRVAFADDKECVRFPGEV